MEDLGKLFGQSLLSLQVLHGSIGRAGQCLQQAAQGVLCGDTSELLMLQREPARCCCTGAQTTPCSLEASPDASVGLSVIAASLCFNLNNSLTVMKKQDRHTHLSRLPPE